MIRDNGDLSPVLVFGPVALDADNTPAAVDLVGCSSALIQIAVGVGGITFDTTDKVEFKITHSDDNSTYAAVAAADIVLGTGADASVGTGGIVKSLIAAHAAATLSDVSYKGNKRYIKILADFSGTHGSPTPMCITVTKSRLRQSGTA